MLSVALYLLLRRVSLSSGSLCWVPLCRMSLFWVSLCWLSCRRQKCLENSGFNGTIDNNYLSFKKNVNQSKYDICFF